MKLTSLKGRRSSQPIPNGWPRIYRFLPVGVIRSKLSATTCHRRPGLTRFFLPSRPGSLFFLWTSVRRRMMEEGRS